MQMAPAIPHSPSVGGTMHLPEELQQPVRQVEGLQVQEVQTQAWLMHCSLAAHWGDCPHMQPVGPQLSEMLESHTAQSPDSPQVVNAVAVQRLGVLLVSQQ